MHVSKLLILTVTLLASNAGLARQSSGGIGGGSSMTVDDFKDYCKEGGGKIIIPPMYPGIKCQYPDGTTIGCRFDRVGGERVCRNFAKKVKRPALRQVLSGSRS